MTPSAGERFWRSRSTARMRHRLARLSRTSSRITRAHAAVIRATGGRIRRSFLFTGGMPVLVLTTVGRKSGRERSTPLAYLKHGNCFAVMASNAGSAQTPAWWLNLQAQPAAQVLAEGATCAVTARRADPSEEATLWGRYARLNPGFDEYRRLATRDLPIVLLEPVAERSSRCSAT